MSTEAPTFPPSSPATPCPACGTLSTAPTTARWCPGCGVDLADPVAERLIALDRRWWELAAEREQLLAALLATRPQAPPPPPPVPSAEPGAPGSSARHLGIPTLLALAGVALLTAAAVVFTAVNWATLPALGQAAILMAATGGAAAAAIALNRRQVPTAAAALGVLTMSLAAVDVLGLHRSGLVTLDEFTVPAAAVVAAGVGWVLSRVGLRWVATAGALAVMIAAVGTTIAVAVAFAVPVAVVALTATGGALVSGATVGVWRTQPARWISALGAGALLTVAGLIGAVGLAAGEVGFAAGLAVIALPAALLLAGTRWAEASLAPASLLILAGLIAAAVDLGAVDLQLAAVAGGAVAAAAWLATRLTTSRRWFLLLGCLPAAVVLAAVVVAMTGEAIARLGATLAQVSWEPVDPWGTVTIVFVAAALLALPQVRAAAEWVAVPVALIVSAALPIVVAWPLLLVLATAVWATRRWLGRDPLAVLLVALAAVGWSAGASWTLAIAAGLTSLLAVLLVSRTGPVRGGIAAGIALAGGGLAAGAAGRAATLHLDVALGVGLVVTSAGAVAVSRASRTSLRVAGPVVAALATVAVPVAATSARVAGVLLLIAAAGWLALASADWRFARWLAALVASIGSIVLLADAGVEVVEAYTLVPFLTLGAIGIWWLLEDREVATLPALTPALLIGLLPSLVALSADPRVLTRTLALTAAAVALAAAGVLARWLAPTLAGGVAALWVAATQLTLVVQLSQRWIAFAAAGVLLVWLAATYERQRQRTQALTDRLGTYR